MAYVSEQKDKAIMFTYYHTNRVVETGTNRPIKLAGLDAGTNYRITEINLYPGVKSTLDDGKVYSGSFLMNVGINPKANARRTSVVLQLTKAD